jgi:hypothetical protein
MVTSKPLSLTNPSSPSAVLVVIAPDAALKSRTGSTMTAFFVVGSVTMYCQVLVALSKNE